MALEEKYGARSGFYFLALEDQDYSYDVRNLEEEIGMIADASLEFGLHLGSPGGGWVRDIKTIILQTEIPQLQAR